MLQLWRKGAQEKECTNPKKEKKQGKGKVKQDDKETTAIVSDGDIVVLSTCDDSCLSVISHDMDWVVDTGASYHATPWLDFFTSYKVGDFGFVKMGNTGTLNIVGIGDICLESNVGCKLVLMDVRHIPNLCLNLISAGKLGEEGFDNYFSNGCWKLTKGSLVVARGKKCCTLYKTQGKICKALINAMENESIMNLWHKRLEHLSEKDMQLIAKKELISDIEGLNKNAIKDEKSYSNSSNKVSSASMSHTPRTEGEILQSSNLKNFVFSELRTATRNFHHDNVLGEGGFGSVFKGWIDEKTCTAAKPGTNMVITVTRINLEGLQGPTLLWLGEIYYLGQLYHPNLVKLVGYCIEDEHRLLVYEFIPRGSLENHLFRTRNSYFQPLSWSLRMKVALGAAKGLAYLHGPEARVIYRDFKTSNILLDSDYNAKLPDFGLAMDGPKDGWLMGTHGYAAPEDIATGHLTARGNVYSFGVVLLEMLTGKRVVDKNRPQGEHNLVEWAKPYLTDERKIFHLMDTHIEGRYSVSGAHRAATLAMKCLDTESENRPQMDEVVKDLEKLQDLEDTEFARCERLGIHHSNPKVGLKNFVFSELRTATRNFHPDGVLEEGGFGSVFKGWIDEKTYTAAKPGTGMVIAVKRLNQEDLLGGKEWLGEIFYLGQLYHPNLVKLVGYCKEDEHCLLVYEFMPRGSLKNHLFESFKPLSWNLRMKVALGAAKGLAYLHSPEARVIFRDFNTSHIFLDADYNAKLSDFGLAKGWPMDGMSHVSTRVMGTCRYAAPEYIATGYLTARCDVFSFGFVLLQMLTGRRVIDANRPQGEQNLVEWAKPYFTSKRKIFRIMDARIKGQYSLSGALRAGTLAVKCLSTEPKFRPTMDEVVKDLEQLQDLKDAEFARKTA